MSVPIAGTSVAFMRPGYYVGSVYQRARHRWCILYRHLVTNCKKGVIDNSC